MNFINHIFRELEENLLKESRCAYMTPPPGEAPTIDEAGAEAVADDAESTKPQEEPELEDHDFKGHAKEFKGKLQKLKDAYKQSTKLETAAEQGIVTQIEGEFNDIEASYNHLIGQIKDSYKGKVEQKKAEYESKIQKIGASHSPEIRNLIKTVGSHIEAADVPQPTTAAAAEPAAAPPAEPETTKDVEAQAEALTAEELEAATEKILAQLKIKDADLTAKIKELVPELNITKEQLKEAGTEALQLTPDQIKLILTEMLPPKLQVKSREEFTTLKDFTSWSNLDDLFDDFDDPAFTYISQHHKIEEPEEGKEGILIDGKPITEIAQLKKFMPSNARDKFDGIVNDVGDHEEAFTKLMEGHNQAGERMMQLRAELENQIAGGPERVGTMEGIVALLQLFAQIQKAFKTSDWEALGDFMEVYKQGPTKVAKAYNESIKAYKDGVKGKQDIGKLVDAYLNPGRGNASADEMFGKTGPSSLFRKQGVEPAIMGHLAENLGVTINSIDNKGGLNKINATTTGGKIVEIIVFKKEPLSEITINELTTVNKKIQRNELYKNKAVTDLAAIKSLLPVGTSKAPPKKKKGPEPENTTEALPENDYIGEKGELKGIEKATRIHDVLPKDIQEAVIIAKEARQGFKAGDKIAVIKKRDTFVIKGGKNAGKRAWVYNGDKIESVVRAEKAA